VLVCFTLLFLTPVFYSMPQNAMAAIVISAVIGLFNYEEWWFLWQVGQLASNP
jgi:sulfate transporter 4